MKITLLQSRNGDRERFVLAVKLGDQARRRGETELRRPVARIDSGQPKWLISPRVIQVKMFH